MQKPWWKEPTRGQWSAFSAAWAGWVLDAFDFTIFIVVAAHIAKEFGVGPEALAGSVTLTLLVRLAGGYVAGWMADKWGRKLPLMLSLLWFAAFDAAIYFAPTYVWVVVLRTLFGFGMGAEWTAGTAMAMESWPARSRKLASGILQAGWPVGFILAAVTAHFVVPAYGWRMMFLIAAAPALLVIPIRFMVPDEYGGKPAATAAAPVTFRELMAPQVRRMIILGSLVMGLGFLVYYGLTTNYMLMSRELGVSTSTAWNNFIIFNVGMMIGVIGAGWVARRFGIIVALVAPALLMVPCLALYVGAVPSLLWVGAFLGGMFGVGYSGVTPVLTTSLFPDNVRGRAIGLVYHIGAMIGALAPVAIAQIARRFELSLASSVAIFVGAALIGMSVAVIALRHRITLPADAADAEARAVADTAEAPAPTPAELPAALAPDCAIRPLAEAPRASVL